MSFPDAYVPVPGKYSPQERDDLFDSIPDKLDKAGGTMTGAINMGNNRITGLANGTGSTDAINKAQLDGHYVIAGKKSGTTLGTAATAAGTQAEASGNYATADGRMTAATTTEAQAHGRGTIASGVISYANGLNTRSNHRSQVAFGEYNAPDPSTAAATDRGNFVEIVGKGTADDARSNARTLDWSGNEQLAGALYIETDTSTPTLDASKKVVTKGELDGKPDLTVLAPAFDTATAYSIGNYVTYSGKVYQFTSAHSAGAWNSSQVVEVYAVGQRVTAGQQNGTAMGWFATAEGYGTDAAGYCAHAEGYLTNATFNEAHSEGDNTTASAYACHAEGLGTIAQSAYQHVFGKYNVADRLSEHGYEIGEFVEIVGAGTSEHRSNARTLDWSGNEWLAGKLQAKSNANYLINWNFLYPVNQLKIALDTAVTATDPATYSFLDCWKLTSGTATLTSTGVTLNGTMTQTIERAPTGTVTASVLCSSGEATATYSSGVFSLTSSGGTIVAVKLEDGGVQTLYRDTTLLDPAPDPTTELLKCQRYLYVADGTENTGLRIVGVAMPMDTTKAVVNFRLPVPMCANPTVDLTAASFNLRVNPSSGAGAISATSVTLGGLKTSQQCTLVLQTTSPMTVGTPYLAVLTTASKIIFNANL